MRPFRTATDYCSSCGACQQRNKKDMSNPIDPVTIENLALEWGIKSGDMARLSSRLRELGVIFVTVNKRRLVSREHLQARIKAEADRLLSEELGNDED